MVGSIMKASAIALLCLNALGVDATGKVGKGRPIPGRKDCEEHDVEVCKDAGPAKNIAVNGDFEAPTLAPWVAVEANKDSGVLQRQNVERGCHASSQQCYFATSNGDGHKKPYEDLYIELETVKDHTYDLTGYQKAIDNTCTVQYRVGQAVQGSDLVTTQTSRSDSATWIKASGSFTAKTKKTKLWVRVNCQLQCNKTRGAVLDDITVVDRENPKECTTSISTSFFPTSTQIITPTSTSIEVIPTPEPTPPSSEPTPEPTEPTSTVTTEDNSPESTSAIVIPTPSPTGECQEWVAHGCISDSRDGRTLSTVKTQDISELMTNELCQDLCKAEGFVFAGTEYGQECWCGNAIENSPSESEQCIVACAGNPAQTCGGPDALNVFKLSDVECAVTSSTITSESSTEASTMETSSTISESSTEASSTEASSTSAETDIVTPTPTPTPTPSVCQEEIAAVNTCATSCINDGGVTFGCAENDYDCLCLNIDALPGVIAGCVVGKCSDPFGVLNAAKAVCECLAKPEIPAESTPASPSETEAGTTQPSATSDITIQTSTPIETQPSATSEYTTSTLDNSPAETTPASPSETEAITTQPGATSDITIQTSTPIETQPSATSEYTTSTLDNSPAETTPASPSETEAITTQPSATSDITIQTSTPIETQPSATSEYTTSTLTTTSIYTISSCAPTITSCPYGSVTSTVVEYTTICPVTPTSDYPAQTPITSIASTNAEQTTSQAPETTSFTTSTVYETNIYTITSCAPTVSNCPIGKVTSTIVSHVTICPVTTTPSGPQPPKETYPGSEETKPVEQPEGPASTVYVIPQKTPVPTYPAEQPETPKPENPENEETPKPENPENEETPKPESPENEETPKPETPENEETPKPENPENEETPEPETPEQTTTYSSTSTSYIFTTVPPKPTGSQTTMNTIVVPTSTGTASPSEIPELPQQPEDSEEAPIPTPISTPSPEVPEVPEESPAPEPEAPEPSTTTPPSPVFTGAAGKVSGNVAAVVVAMGAVLML